MIWPTLKLQVNKLVDTSNIHLPLVVNLRATKQFKGGRKTAIVISSVIKQIKHAVKLGRKYIAYSDT